MGSRVLVCDHERHIVRLLQVNLERMGWSVTPAYEGLEALALSSLGGYGSFILGADLPDLSGIEITKLLRLNRESEGSFILVMLSSADPRTTAEAYLAGADLVVTKPFDVRGLSMFLR